MDEKVEKLNKAIDLFYEHKQHQDIEKRRNEILKINSQLFDKASTYTNLVIVAGYVVFFKVWSNSKDYLSDSLFVISALFVSTSSLLFILFEIYKASLNHKTFSELNEVVNAPLDKFNEKLENYNIKMAKLDSRMIRVWKFVFPVTVIIGICGAGILMSSFIKFLINKL